jgi:hypothetical protein
VNERPRRVRRRLQFSLRGLLIAMVVLGPIAGWVGSRVQRSMAQRLAVARLQRAGADVTLSVVGPPAWRRWLGDGWFERVDTVAFRQSRCTDADLANLARLVGLRVLEVDSPAVTDAALAYLRGQSQLEALWVAGTQITSGGLASLEVLERLEILGLDSAQLNERTAEWMAAQPRLAAVEIRGAGLSPAQVERLSQLRGLRSLLLTNGAATDELAPALAKLTSVEVLFLLQSPQISDRGLAPLADLPNLRHLALDGTSTTEEGVRRLQERAPFTLIVDHAAPGGSTALATEHDPREPAGPPAGERPGTSGSPKPIH